MTFLKSLTTSGVGFLIVFIGLSILIALVYAMGKICARLLNENDAPKTKKTEASPAAPTVGIENREELVAILSAAVAEELGTDVSAIRVVSLKQIR